MVEATSNGIILPDADPSVAAGAVGDLVDSPFDHGPFGCMSTAQMVYVDLANHGSEVGLAVLKRLRAGDALPHRSVVSAGTRAAELSRTPEVSMSRKKVGGPQIYCYADAQ